VIPWQLKGWFEDITAIYYDYTALREQFKDSGVLDTFSAIIKNLSSELERIGAAIQQNTTYTKRVNFDEQILVLKNSIDETVKREGKEHTLVLKRIMVNVRRIMQRIREITLIQEEWLQREGLIIHGL
jgi:hypothetical protein